MDQTKEDEGAIAKSALPNASLGQILRYTVLQAAHHLHESIKKAETQRDSRKKETLKKFAEKSKGEFIRLLVLAHWAASLPSYSQDLDSIIEDVKAQLSERNISFYNAAASIHAAQVEIREYIIPRFDILTAVDVLVTGSYFRLPFFPVMDENEKVDGFQEIDSDQDYNVKLARLMKTKLLNSKIPPMTRGIHFESNVAIMKYDSFDVTITLVPLSFPADQDAEQDILILMDDQRYKLYWKIVGYQPRIMAFEEDTFPLSEELQWIGIFPNTHMDQDQLLSIYQLCNDATETIRLQSLKDQAAIYIKTNPNGNFSVKSQDGLKFEMQYWSPTPVASERTESVASFSLQIVGESVVCLHNPKLPTKIDKRIQKQIASQRVVSFSEIFICVKYAYAESMLTSVCENLATKHEPMKEYLSVSTRLQEHPVLLFSSSDFNLELMIDPAVGKAFIAKASRFSRSDINDWNRQFQSVSLSEDTVSSIILQGILLSLAALFESQGYKRLDTASFDLKYPSGRTPTKPNVLLAYNNDFMSSSTPDDCIIISLYITNEMIPCVDVFVVKWNKDGTFVSRNEARFFSTIDFQTINQSERLMKIPRIAKETTHETMWKSLVEENLGKLRIVIARSVLERSCVDVGITMKDYGLNYFVLSASGIDFHELKGTTLTINPDSSWEVIIPTVTKPVMAAFSKSNSHIEISPHGIVLKYTHLVLSEKQKFVKDLRSFDFVLRAIQSIEKVFIGRLEGTIQFVNVEPDTIRLRLVESDRSVTLKLLTSKYIASFWPVPCYQKFFQDNLLSPEDVGPKLCILQTIDKVIKKVEKDIQTYQYKIFAIVPLSLSTFRISLLSRYSPDPSCSKICVFPFFDFRFTNMNHISVDDLNIRSPQLNTKYNINTRNGRTFYNDAFGLNFRADVSFESIPVPKFLTILPSLLQYMSSVHFVSIFLSALPEGLRPRLVQTGFESFRLPMESFVVLISCSTESKTIEFSIEADATCGWTEEERSYFSNFLKKNTYAETKAIQIMEILQYPLNVLRVLSNGIKYMSKLSDQLSFILHYEQGKPYYLYDRKTKILSKCILQCSRARQEHFLIEMAFANPDSDVNPKVVFTKPDMREQRPPQSVDGVDDRELFDGNREALTGYICPQLIRTIEFIRKNSGTQPNQ